MGNQVDALKAANIPVATINSNTQFADRDQIIKDLSCGKYDTGGPKLPLIYLKATQQPDSCMSPLSLCLQNHFEGFLE